ncbi:MAG: hypothetical protein ACO1SV_19485 [Fimbriimonas sp.]
MRTRSWLAKAESIHDLGDFFYIPKSGQPWDEARDRAAESNWLRRLDQPSPVDPEFAPYLGSAMHDPWIVGIERTPHVVRVRLDSLDADISALGSADHLEFEPIPSRWPVDLLFHDPVYMWTARSDPTDALRIAPAQNEKRPLLRQGA